MRALALLPLAVVLLSLACAADPELVVTAKQVERTTAAQDAVERLIDEGRIPVHERAGTRLVALEADTRATRYCVRYRERDAEVEASLCRSADEQADFAVACFRAAEPGQALPRACRSAIP
jgi:hypothetical protein